MKQLLDKLCCINISQHLSENQCTEYIFGCSQNSAISFVIALPGKNLQGSGAIMKNINGRQIGQKWGYILNLVTIFKFENKLD